MGACLDRIAVRCVQYSGPSGGSFLPLQWEEDPTLKRLGINSSLQSINFSSIPFHQLNFHVDIWLCYWCFQMWTHSCFIKSYFGATCTYVVSLVWILNGAEKQEEDFSPLLCLGLKTCPFTFKCDFGFHLLWYFPLIVIQCTEKADETKGFLCPRD